MTIEEAIKAMQNIDLVLSVTESEHEAARMAISALRAQAERENPQPLTLEELRRMDGQPVWVTFLDDVFTIGHTAPLWMIVNAEEKEFQAKNEYVCFSDIGCIAYVDMPMNVYLSNGLVSA